MNIAFIGYGEVGKILAEDLRIQGLAVAAFDLKLHGEAGEPMREHALLHGVALADSAADAVRGAQLVISAVTASQAVPVAQACAPALQPGTYFLDLNSASPGARPGAQACATGTAWLAVTAEMTSCASRTAPACESAITTPCSSACSRSDSSTSPCSFRSKAVTDRS